MHLVEEFYLIFLYGNKQGNFIQNTKTYICIIYHMLLTGNLRPPTRRKNKYAG